MVVKQKRTKRLSQIMQNNKHFNRAVDAYLDQLRKRRDWQKMEERMLLAKNSGWPDEKVIKMFEWERKASELYNTSVDKAMESIKLMSDEITDEDYDNLRNWIKTNNYSKEAWDKSKISINDSMSLIRAKVIHLAFMARSKLPVNIGQIIKSED